MNDLQLRLAQALRRAAERLRKTALPLHLVIQLEQLAEQVDQPCVVAVVGRVKAGKSTFINALLGEDLAKVGPDETTATINYFRNGTPPNPELPVRCYWRSGKFTDVSRDFLDSLQGNDIETLRKAESIDHLEYHLQNHYLEQMILVDTPGTGAIVDEHQNRTAEFLQLSRQLRERHHQDTQHIGNKADAVIYLIGETARITDEAFLQEFQEATQGQSRSLNAIGVMAKIDLNPEVVERREELARKISAQLQTSLNTVIPVSAGMHRALQGLFAQNQAGLVEMENALRSIPSETLEEMLADPEWYLTMDCPLSIDERKALRGEMRWKAFTTIASVVTDPSLTQTEIVTKLEAIAGFAQLHEILDRHFVKRGRLLRSYRIVIDAMHVLETVKFTFWPEYLKREAENKAKQDRFLTFFGQIQSCSPIARELEAFVKEHLAPRTDLGAVIGEVEREIGRFKYELEDENTDFTALQQLEDDTNLFTLEELGELRPLFGLHGLETSKRLPASQITLSYIGKQQAYWERKYQGTRSPIVRDVAQQAIRRYGLIADTLVTSRMEH